MFIVKHYKILNKETGQYRRVKGWRHEEEVMYRQVRTPFGQAQQVIVEIPQIHANEWIPPDGEEITENEYNSIREDHPYNEIVLGKIDKLTGIKNPKVETDALEAKYGAILARRKEK